MFKFTPRSLQFQMIVSFVFTAALVAAVSGLPAIWVIREQLDQQAWSQIDRGQKAARLLYANRLEEMADFARLVAGYLSLQEGVGAAYQGGLSAMLNPMLVEKGYDVLWVCASDGQALTLAGEAPEANLCQTGQEYSGFEISRQFPSQVWMLASSPLEGRASSRGSVVVGERLDTDFAIQMRQLTGMEHTILVDGGVIATSYAARPENLTTLSPRSGFISTPEGGICCTYEVARRPYYAVRIPMQAPGLEVEVALPVGDIVATQNRLILHWLGGMLTVAMIGSAIGIVLARRVSRPLISLASAAERISQGDLSLPVSVETRIPEVVLVSRALEGARADLARTIQDLQGEKAWVNHLLESIVEGIMTLDEQGRITFFSHGAERITGWSKAEVLQRPCDDVLKVAGDGATFSRSIPEVGQRNRIVVKVADGREAILSFTRAQLSPSGAGDGEVALVFRDVSESVTIHRIMGYFIANIAHEFRTPLSALAASIELLRDQAGELEPFEMDELLKSLHLGVLSLQTLVDNLLESSSIEVGHFRVSPRPQDMKAIIQDAVNTLHPLLEKYNQRLVLDLPASLPKVMADHRRIVQVLVNLLSNANKYGPADAEINLRVRVQDGWVRVEVADRGPGIAEEHRDLLFRRFEYPAAMEGQSKMGAGLGLSVVKAIVEAHGGRAQAENRSGGGALFWFTLPIADET